MNPTDSLPAHLAERVTPVNAHAVRAEGEFVVYWMRTALRAHENPALDVARTIGARLAVPVFVYHALSERYPFASDRHHTFILEGARDVEAECAARGIGYAFHLERPGHRTKALRALAARAAVIVTETMPIPPLSTLTARLGASVDCAVLAVDTACVVPMPLVETLHTRAFAYRQATAALRRARVGRAWPADDSSAKMTQRAFVPALPFEPLALASADIPSLVAQCDIDHGVAPVAHTPGGSVAGYIRWRRFVESGALTRYAARRNDPVGDGVSRMSAYLHYGMVSPLRLAREASAVADTIAASNTPSDGGAEKYLDELLVWRELAYAFCYHHGAPDTLDAVPAWASETLARHESDDRTVLSWETLARGRTGDALWDAAQQSLLVHGELHNNVRMTWGKALLSWTSSARDALSMLEDLNHRYALDGRDPASYGGLLWCLGQFDRPFSPEIPVLGTVRPRETAAHAQRMNVTEFARRAARPASAHRSRVVVVGAGVAGLACARSLTDHGWDVTVLEKSRGVGGRTSTRRDEGWQFDHGAPSFDVRDERLAPYLTSWCADGIISRVRGAWVGTPGMSALARHLAADLTVVTRATVQRLARVHGRWYVSYTVPESEPEATTEADIVVLAMPAPQSAALLRPLTDPGGLDRVSMDSCLTAMVVVSGDDTRLLGYTDSDTDSEAGAGTPFALIRQRSGVNAMSATAFVVHANAAWSREHLEMPLAEVASTLSAELVARLTPSVATHRASSDVVLARGHRWRYAHVVRGLPERCLWWPERSLGACGDWGGLGREADRRDLRRGVERAWLSGIAMAGQLLGAPLPGPR